ncbi:hypothetical protein PIB30_070787 [Stylosanthes scabra]|uniref:Uncharacterized protein n=1 Tax=Stylosanthes scabra TaxID=79078 RepID=A0ABU6TNR3_9FABA|nr:hypothetical protein [Stylosanthes scabra]
MVVRSHSSLLVHYLSSSLLINPPVVVATRSESSQLVTSLSPCRLHVVAASSHVAAVIVMAFDI